MLCTEVCLVYVTTVPFSCNTLNSCLTVPIRAYRNPLRPIIESLVEFIIHSFLNYNYGCTHLYDMWWKTMRIIWWEISFSFQYMQFSLVSMSMSTDTQDSIKNYENSWLHRQKLKHSKCFRCAHKLCCSTWLYKSSGANSGIKYSID